MHRNKNKSKSFYKKYTYVKTHTYTYIHMHICIRIFMNMYIRIFIQVKRYENEECTSMYHQYINERSERNSCFAVVRVQNLIGIYLDIICLYLGIVW